MSATAPTKDPEAIGEEFQLPFEIRTGGLGRRLVVEGLNSLCGEVEGGISVVVPDVLRGSFVLNLDDLEAVCRAAREQQARNGINNYAALKRELGIP